MPDALRPTAHALRALAKQPGVSLAAFVTLTLGIWATTTMFSFTYTSAVRSLPVPDADEIVYVERNVTASNADWRVALHDFADWRERLRTFETLAAFQFASANVSDDRARPERFSAARITPSTFDVLGVSPRLGRPFGSEDVARDAEPTVILGHAAWRDRYGGDPGVLGRTLRVNGVERTVIGVMDERFAFPLGEAMWLPLRIDPLETPRSESPKVEVFGRLADGASLRTAQADLASVDAQLAAEHPATNEGLTSRILPYNTAFLGTRVATFQWTMVAAVFLALVIACINVANLLLARGASRVRDLAVRRALGASRGRIVGQLLLETLLIAGAGGVVGVVAAQATLRRMDTFIRGFADGFYWIHLEVEWRGLLVTAGLVLFTTLVAGLLPALQATAVDLAGVLRDESRGSSGRGVGRLIRGLVVAEIGIGVALLAGAGIMVKSLNQLRSADYGFEPGQFLTGRVALSEAYDPGERRRFWDELLREVSSAPGARGAAVTSVLPAHPGPRIQVAVQGESYPNERQTPLARYAVVSQGLFDLLGIDPVEGRLFGSQDRAETEPVALVNVAFSRRHWGDESPVGRQIRVGEPDADAPWRTVVGVVPDLHLGGLRNEEPWGVYLPLQQADETTLFVVTAGAGDPLTMSSPLRDRVARLDRDLPVFDVRTLERSIERSAFFFQFLPRIFVVLGVIAFAMATVGLYGVMAFGVTRRRAEFGIRMALGAERGRLIRSVLAGGARQILVGTVIGVVLAWILNSGLGLWLVGVNPRDPVILSGTVGLVVVTGLLATLLPARAAARVSPVEALRSEG